VVAFLIALPIVGVRVAARLLVLAARLTRLVGLVGRVGPTRVVVGAVAPARFRRIGRSTVAEPSDETGSRPVDRNSVGRPADRA
jgi:hypothetical protein